jgi:acyl carrier protein
MDTKERIRAVLEKLIVNSSVANDERLFFNERVMDSLKSVEFLFRLEEEFGISFDAVDFDIMDFNSINALAGKIDGLV